MLKNMLSGLKKLNKTIKYRRIAKYYKIPLLSRRRRRKLLRRLRPAIYALNIKRKRRAILKKMRSRFNARPRLVKHLSKQPSYDYQRIFKILILGKNKIKLAALKKYKRALRNNIMDIYEEKWFFSEKPPLEDPEIEFHRNLESRLLKVIGLKEDLQKDCARKNESFVDVLFDAVAPKKNADNLVKSKSLKHLRNEENLTLLESEQEDRSKKLLKNMILLDLLMAAKLEMGERIYTNNKNEKIKNYFMGIRNEHAIYNLNILIIGLRLTLAAITSRIKYKKRTLINYSNPRNHGNFHLSYIPIQEFPKDLFLVTWKKWIGGILTNFKRLSKRIISRMKNDKKENNDKKKIGQEDTVEDYRIAFPRDVPKLPAFVVSTTDCHWTLNESKRMKIKTTQLIEISHLGYFGDINLAINTHYLGLRSFTCILQECMLHAQRNAKFLYKGKLNAVLDVDTLDLDANFRRSRKLASKVAPKCDVFDLFKGHTKTTPLATKPVNPPVSKPLKTSRPSSKKRVVSKPQPPVNTPRVPKPKRKPLVINCPDRFQFPDRIQRLGGYLSWDKIKKNPEKYALNLNLKVYDN